MSNKALKSISEITDVIARVTRILSGRSIQVIQEGLKIGVEYDAKGIPTKVYLPSLTDNPSPELLTAIHGFVDKEVAGLLYSDHDYQHRARGQGEFKKGMAKYMQEIIEDSRTERSMKTDFIGSAANFSKNHDFAIREILEPENKTERDPKKRLANLTMPAIRAAAGDLAYEQFMDGKWEQLGKLGGAILHYADEIQNIDSTKGTFELTRKIIQRMEEEEQNDDDEGDDEGEGEGEGQGSGSSGVAAPDDGDSDGDSAGGSGGGDGSDPSDEDEGGGGGGDGDDDADGDDSGKPNPNEDLSKENKKLDKRTKRKSGKAADGSDAGSGVQQGLTEFEDMDDTYQAMDFNSKYQEKIKKFAKDEQLSAPYVPYSRQYDYVGPFPAPDKQIARFGSDTTAKRIYEAAAKDSHVIQQQVQKLFMAKALVRWEPGLKRGKINSAALYKLRNNDPRIFRRKIESDSRDIAVSLLLDMSGSMSNAKIQYACIAAMMFSQVLTTLNIPHEVSAFSTYSGYYRGSAANFPHAKDINTMLNDVRYASHGGVQYARFTPLTNFIAKGYDERLTEDTKRLIAMIPSGYSDCMSGNVDGESVQIAGQRLLRRKEKRKIMIVMSDGSPAGDSSGAQLDQHLKNTVKQFESAGVEMLGLGLMDTSVKRYYPKNQTVNRVEDIPTKILELTRQMVIGA